jgi:hypothetical protein
MSSDFETHPVFARLANELTPRVKEAELRLKSVLPGATVSVFFGSVGAATSFKGAQLGIECLLPDVADSQPDNVAFTVTLCHMDREPRLAADVCWGHPAGYVEASLSGQEGSSDHWPFATEVRIAELIKETPHLLLTLEQAAQRGHPLEGENEGSGS